MPYSQFYVDSKKKERLSKNGKEKIVTIIKLIEKTEMRKSFSSHTSVDDVDADEDEDEENEEYSGNWWVGSIKYFA